jgi:hypothetical protein
LDFLRPTRGRAVILGLDRRRDKERLHRLIGYLPGELTFPGRERAADPHGLFDNQGNQTAAARQLHVSVRAVAYRLDRVHALTGYHAGEPTQRFTLHTAVLGARLLGWPPESPNGAGRMDPRP